METRVKIDGCRAVEATMYMYMTNLECKQLLLTVPEVSFDFTMKLACSSFFALYIRYFFACAIDRYCGYCCIVIPDIVRLGTRLQNLLTGMCDVGSGIHHVIIFTRPSPHYSYCKRR